MRKFLKTLATIIAILAILVLLTVGLDMWLNNGAILSSINGFLGTSLSSWTVLVLAAGALCIALIMSPKGVSKATDRIVEGFGSLSEGAGKLLGKTTTGVFGGLAAGLGLGGFGKWLLLGLGVAGIFWLWPKRHRDNSVTVSVDPSSGYTPTEYDPKFDDSLRDAKRLSYREKRIARALRKSSNSDDTSLDIVN